MKPKTYKFGGTILGNKFNSASIKDKLLILLEKPSLLNKEELTELRRIKSLSSKAYVYHKDYITSTYDKYHTK